MNALTLLPDGRLAAGHGDGTDDSTVRVWDLQRHGLDAVLYGHTSKVCALAALPDGRLLSSSFGCLKVWDTRMLSLHGRQASTAAQCTMTLPAPGDSNVFALAVLPDGRIVSGHDDGGVHVWR